MAVCKLSYPANSNVLEIVSTDPIDSFNETQLRTVNVLNNVLLRNADLTQYPGLKARVEQGDITDQEFADILIDNGLSLDFVQETFVNDFPVEVDIEQITEIVNQMIDSGYERENIVGQSNPENITTLLALQDLYYNNFPFNVSACASFVNPFTKLISVLTTARDLASGITDIIGNIQNVINDIKYFSLSGIISSLSNQLKNFQEQLINQVDQIKDALLQKVKGIADKAKRLFEQIKTFPRGAYRFIQKKINQVEKFFSAENIDRIKSKVRGFFKFNLDQYEDLLPDVLNFLLLAGCGLSGILKQFLNEPVNRLQKTVDNYVKRHDAEVQNSTKKRNDIKAIGGIRINPQVRAEQQHEGIQNYNNTDPEEKIPNPPESKAAESTGSLEPQVERPPAPPLSAQPQPPEDISGRFSTEKEVIDWLAANKNKVSDSGYGFTYNGQTYWVVVGRVNGQSLAGSKEEFYQFQETFDRVDNLE